jgi:hypothetical protein
LERGHVGYEQLIDSINRLYGRLDTRNKLVIGSGIFTGKQQWLFK